LPLTKRLTCVWLFGSKVNRRGEPGKTTQDWVTAKPTQVAFVNVEMPVRLNTRLPLFENVKKLLSPMLAAVIGLFTSMPSVLLKQPAVPSTPEQPAKARVVLVATSESQAADMAGHAKFVPPSAAGSLLKMTSPMVAVTVPVEPVAKVPETDADAVDIDKTRAQLSPSRFPALLTTGMQPY